MNRMLIATNQTTVVEVLSSCFSSHYKIDIAPDKNGCLQMLQKSQYEFFFIDVLFIQSSSEKENHLNYRALLQPFFDISPTLQIIILCTQETIRKAVEAVRAGASNYLTYPIDTNEARYIVDTTLEALRMQSELDYLRDKFWHGKSLGIVRTRSPLMKEVFEKVKTVAPTDTTVLITGETGTGKGVLANLIHNHSRRKDKQFISVHCGAIPETLLESELFGHEKGAFTGAIKRKLGQFEIAQGGTIFLDEIGTMPASAQIKLLQILQDRVFQRVGGEDSIYCDVRVIAASNTNLKKMTEIGTFRKDLFYRLNVFPIELPPLRERKEDIPLFIDMFLKRLNKKYAKNIIHVHPEVLSAFDNYSWPGNIRELENVIERAYLLEISSVLTPERFPIELITSDEPHAEISLNPSLTLAEIRKASLENIERNYLKEQLSIHRGKINDTAKAAGITPRQLHKLMTKFKISKKEFKIKSYP